MDRGLGTRQFVDLFVSTEPDLQVGTNFVRGYRALQVRLPRLLFGQGPSGILRVGRHEAGASGLASISRTHTGASPAQSLRASGQGRAVQMQRDVPDADRHRKLGQDRPRLDVHYPPLSELKYLLLNFTTLANQLARYKLAEAGLSAFVQRTAGATTFVPPTESASLFVHYGVLVEEIKRYL